MMADQEALIELIKNGQNKACVHELGLGKDILDKKSAKSGSDGDSETSLDCSSISPVDSMEGKMHV